MLLLPLSPPLDVTTFGGGGGGGAVVPQDTLAETVPAPVHELGKAEQVMPLGTLYVRQPLTHDEPGIAAA